MGENLQDFQFNNEVTQQSHEDHLSLDQEEILNVSCEDGGELSLNILLEEVLAVDVVDEIIVIGDEMGRVFRS